MSRLAWELLSPCGGSPVAASNERPGKKYWRGASESELLPVPLFQITATLWAEMRQPIHHRSASYRAGGPESESHTRLGRNKHLIWEICSSKTGCSGNHHDSGYLKGLKTAKQCHHPRGQGQDPSHFWPLDLSPSWHKCNNQTLAECFPILPLSRSLGKGLLA